MTRHVFIAGGGPAGLAAASLFADLGWRVTLAERRASPSDFEKNKAFNYLIDGRGQRLLQRLGIADRLGEFGVPTRGFTATTIAPDGRVTVAANPAINPERPTAYWVTRRNFLEMLYAAAQEREGVRLLYGHTFAGIGREGEDRVVRLEHGAGETSCIRPDLVLACDGFRSSVRDALSRQPETLPGHFAMVEHASPADRLCYKVLNLPATFVAANGFAVDDHAMGYNIPSRKLERRRNCRLFAFPVPDDEHPRSVNVIREADHEIWTIKDADSLFAYLEDAFPQLDVRALVSREEAADFAAMDAGRFPRPQYARNLYQRLGEDCHALLIGDAAHAFPPDLGLGVNSALEDLEVFALRLEASDDLGAACAAYEAERLPQIAALVRLVATAAPWQYEQSPWRLRLWFADFLARSALNRVAPAVIDRPAFWLTQDPSLAYVEIERRTKRTDRVMRGLAGMLTLGFAAGAAILLARRRET